MDKQAGFSKDTEKHEFELTKNPPEIVIEKLTIQIAELMKKLNEKGHELDITIQKRNKYLAQLHDERSKVHNLELTIAALKNSVNVVINKCLKYRRNADEAIEFLEEKEDWKKVWFTADVLRELKLKIKGEKQLLCCNCVNFIYLEDGFEVRCRMRSGGHYNTESTKESWIKPEECNDYEEPNN